MATDIKLEQQKSSDELLTNDLNVSGNQVVLQIKLN